MDKDLILLVIRGSISDKLKYKDMTIDERTVFVELIKNGVLCDERSTLKIDFDSDRSSLLNTSKETKWKLNRAMLKMKYGIESIL